MEQMMQRIVWRYSALFPLLCLCSIAGAQQTLTWEQVRLRFEQNNPTLLADQLNVDESKAQEITAHLRPNPELGLLSDQITPFNSGPSHGPLAYLLPSATVSYLIEREHKRQLG